MRKFLLIASVVLIVSAESYSQTPANIETRLLSRLSEIEKWSNYGNNPDEKKLDAANARFKQDLLKYTRVPASLNYGFPRLKKKMQIATSKDGRVRLYSWDMGTGGTMHDYASVSQYRTQSGNVHSAEDSGGGFYHDIFQLGTSSGSIYLRVSTFVASGTLLNESLDVIRIQGEQLIRGVKLIRTAKGLTDSVGFEYDFSSVMDREERPVKLFKFDEAKRSFSFPVVVTDDEMPQGRVTNRFVTYRFNGKYFVKIS